MSSEAALRAAFGNASETSITLAANITLTNCGAGHVSRGSATAVTIHGKGHTIRQNCAAITFDQSGVGTVTLESLITVAKPNFDAVSAGARVVLVDSSISNTGSAAAVDNGTTVSLTRSNITGVGTGGDGVTSGGAVSLTQSRISSVGNAACEGITNGGDVTLDQSTISGCTDGITTGGNVVLTNSTIANASANGIVTGNAVTLSFATIVHNGTGVQANMLVANASVIANSTGRRLQPGREDVAGLQLRR